MLRSNDNHCEGTMTEVLWLLLTIIGSAGIGVALVSLMEA